MSTQVTVPVQLPTQPLVTQTSEAEEGLLITSDGALVRAFLGALRRCVDCPVAFDVRASIRDARELEGERHRWVAVDLGGAVAPADAVGLARRLWPRARIGVLSCWWSEHDAAARELADVVIHKPIRSPEVAAFLRRQPAAAPNPALPTTTNASQLRDAG